jgi:hypothetical protein
MGLQLMRPVERFFAINAFIWSKIKGGITKMSLLYFLMTSLMIHFIPIGSKGPAAKTTLIRFLSGMRANMMAKTGSL